MKALRILGLAAVAGLSACGPIDDIDFGGGGGGGGSFSRGFVFVRGESNSARNVFVVDDTGDPNSPLRLTTQGGAYEPAVSRDGRRVAFVYKAGSILEVRTVPTTGQGQPSTVFASTNTTCPGCTDLRFPTFSPDGNTLVFTVYKGTSPSSLARVRTDGSGFQFLPNGNPYFFGSSSFTADGLGVIAAGGQSSSQLNLLVHVNLTSGLANVISSGLGNEGAQVVGSRVTVSPDGTKVAFDARTSSGSRIFVGKLNGQQQVYDITQVTGKPGVQDTYPSWRGNTELGFLLSEVGGENVYRVSASSMRGSGNLVFVLPKATEPSYGGI
ncbi:hypothetical protein [Archangium sp.]|uniref:TolB family protein n=1 Tax=Archangium sp. TaxID=1872627 RepID=UPI002D2B3187|nr:hypothetical protein [Archangium sp.]HYO59087.1 hypothetical protein [Archangium sp.]